MSGEGNPHFGPLRTTDLGTQRVREMPRAYLREHPDVEAMFDEPTATTLARVTASISQRRMARPSPLKRTK